MAAPVRADHRMSRLERPKTKWATTHAVTAATNATQRAARRSMIRSPIPKPAKSKLRAVLSGTGDLISCDFAPMICDTTPPLWLVERASEAAELGFKASPPYPEARLRLCAGLKGTIRGHRLTSGTGIFSTQCATPSCRRIDSRIFGGEAESRWQKRPRRVLCWYAPGPLYPQSPGRFSRARQPIRCTAPGIVKHLRSWNQRCVASAGSFGFSQIEPFRRHQQGEDQGGGGGAL